MNMSVEGKATGMGRSTWDVIAVKKAAEQGNAWAQFQLGIMYAKGEGTPQDYQQAIHWYQKAAEQVDAESLLMLGAMCRNGDGVLRSPEPTELDPGPQNMAPSPGGTKDDDRHP